MTAAASFTTFAAGILLISIFGRLLGATILGEYLLLRRVAAWFQPLTQLGLGVALPRYTAYSAQRHPVAQLAYFLASAICIFPVVFAFGVVLGLVRATVGKVLFGSAELSNLVLPVFLLILGGGAQMIVYGFYRGRLMMKRAGALQLCAGAVPIVTTAALFHTRSVVMIVSATGLCVFAVAFVFGLPIIKEIHRSRAQVLRNVGNCARELLRYGLWRVPGELSLGALLAIGPVVATHYMPVKRVSYLLLALSMLTVASISTEPLGLVFLSKLSMMLADNRRGDVEKYVRHLTSAVLDCSVFIAIQLIIFADVLIQFWIGPKMLDGVSVIRVLLVGVPFYMFYMASRSAVDAGSVKPLNARNVTISLGALLLGLLLTVAYVPGDTLLQSIAGCLVISFVLLASLTGVALTALYGAHVEWKKSVLPFCYAIVIGAVSLACHDLAKRSFLVLSALELVFAVTFLAMCHRSGTRWLHFIFEMAFHSKPVEDARSSIPA